MRIIDKTKKNNPFFEEIALGQTFRQDGHLFIKIANCFTVEDIEEYFGSFYALKDIDDLRDCADELNAYCLDGNFLTHIGNDNVVEPVNCEVHIV